MRPPLLALFVAAAAALAASPATADARYAWRVVEPAGFGDRANRGVVSLEALGGRLLAGTERRAGAGPPQLWTTETGEPGSWRQVSDLRPPLPPSARAITALAGAPGGPWFLGTRDPAGAAVYRSDDGVTWELSTPPGSGWRPARATAVHALAVHRGAVYAGTGHPRGGAVWRISLAPGGRFEPVLRFAGRRRVTDAVTALQAFRGRLYAGTRRRGADARLWRSADGSRSTWRPVRVHERGRVRPGNRTMGSALTVLRGHLLVATANRFGAEMYGTRDGRRWRVEAASGIAGAQRPEIPDFGHAFGELWLTEVPGVARVWQAEFGRLPMFRGLGFGPTNDDGFGQRTVRDGRPVVAGFGDAVYWGGEDAVRGAQVRRLDRATIDAFDATGPGVEFVPGPLRLAPDGRIAVSIRCPEADPGGCHGELSLRTRRRFRVGTRRRTLQLGREIFEMDAGRSLTLRLRVGSRERRIVRRLARVAVRARNVALDNAYDTSADYVLETRAP